METEMNKLSPPNPWFRLWQWFRYDFFGIVPEMRLSYLPPLMVYFAAGVSGFTGIVESFYVKQEAIFFGSLAVIAYLMSRLLRDLEPVKRHEIITWRYGSDIK